MFSRLPSVPLRMDSVEIAGDDRAGHGIAGCRHGELAQLFGQGHAGQQGVDPAHRLLTFEGSCVKKANILLLGIASLAARRPAG